MTKKHKLDKILSDSKITIDSIKKPYYSGMSLISIALMRKNIKVIKKILKIDPINYYYADQYVFMDLIRNHSYDILIEFLSLLSKPNLKDLLSGPRQLLPWIPYFFEMGSNEDISKIIKFPLDFTIIVRSNYIVESYFYGLRYRENIDMELTREILELAKPFYKKYKGLISPLTDVCTFNIPEQVFDIYLSVYPDGLIEYNNKYFTPLIVSILNKSPFFTYAINHIKKHKRNDHNVLFYKNPILEAIQVANIEAIELLLSFDNLDLDVYNYDLNTPAHLILMKSKEFDDKIKDEIISRTKNVNQINMFGFTVLHELATQNLLEYYKDILSKKICDPYIKNINGHTTVHLCNDIDLLASIVVNGIINNAKNITIQTKCIKKKVVKSMKSQILTCIKQEFNNVLKGKHSIVNSTVMFSQLKPVNTVAYTSADEDSYMFFLYLMKNKKISKLHNLKMKSTGTVLSKYTELFNKYSEISGMEIWWHNIDNNIIPCNFDKHIKKLKPGIYFMFLTILFDIGTHQNCLIIDSEKKMIIRFEPHGHVTFGDIFEFDNMMKKLCKKIKYSYFEPSMYMSGSSFQTLSFESNVMEKKIGDPNGFCLAWTIWFTELYVDNPTVPLSNLMMETLKKMIYTNVTLLSHIRSYSNKLLIFRCNFLKSIKYPMERIFNKQYIQSDSELIYNEINKQFLLMRST